MQEGEPAHANATSPGPRLPQTSCPLGSHLLDQSHSTQSAPPRSRPRWRPSADRSAQRGSLAPTRKPGRPRTRQPVARCRSRQPRLPTRGTRPRQRPRRERCGGCESRERSWLWCRSALGPTAGVRKDPPSSPCAPRSEHRNGRSPRAPSRVRRRRRPQQPPSASTAADVLGVPPGRGQKGPLAPRLGRSAATPRRAHARSFTARACRRRSSPRATWVETAEGLMPIASATSTWRQPHAWTSHTAVRCPGDSAWSAGTSRGSKSGNRSELGEGSSGARRLRDRDWPTR